MAAVVRVKDPDEAIEVANDSLFGLGGNLWTRDIDRARSWRAASRPDRCSSTAWPPPTLACPSAASSERLRARAFGVRHPRVREYSDGLDWPRTGSAHARRPGRIAEYRE